MYYRKFRRKQIGGLYEQGKVVIPAEKLRDYHYVKPVKEGT